MAASEVDTSDEVDVVEADTNDDSLGTDYHKGSSIESGPRTPQDDMAELTLLADHAEGAPPVIRCEDPFANPQAEVPPE